MNLPGASRPLTIISAGAAKRKYVKGVTIDGVPVSSDRPIIMHDQIKDGAEIVFEMAESPQAWGSSTVDKPIEDHTGEYVGASNNIFLTKLV